MRVEPVGEIPPPNRGAGRGGGKWQRLVKAFIESGISCGEIKVEEHLTKEQITYRYNSIKQAIKSMGLWDKVKVFKRGRSLFLKRCEE